MACIPGRCQGNCCEGEIEPRKQPLGPARKCSSLRGVPVEVQRISNLMLHCVGSLWFRFHALGAASAEQAIKIGNMQRLDKPKAQVAIA